MEEEEGLFQIDIDVEVKEGETVQKPEYEVDYMLTKNDWEDGQIEDKPEEESTQVVSETCWNCGKVGHSLRECQMPRDHQRINQSKKSFVKNQLSNKRYHDNKFAKFRPGHHSSKLREALGLRRDEIPRHIYMMRVLGYPPGWLADAKITNSGIKMYNSRGKRIKEVDEEDGEILNKFMKYDIEKIVEFPGFNVPLERGVKDDSRAQGFPPMKPEHELPNFIKYLEEISTNTDIMSDDSTDDEHVDMDISEMLPNEIIEEVRVINKRINEINSENASSDSRSAISNDSYEEGEIVVTRKITPIKPDIGDENTTSEDVSNESSNPAMKRLISEAEEGEIVSSESSRTLDGCEMLKVNKSELKDNNALKLEGINTIDDTKVQENNSTDVINVNTISSGSNEAMGSIVNTDVENSRKRSLPLDDTSTESDESKKPKNSKSPEKQNENDATSENENTQDTVLSRSETSERNSQNDESSTSSFSRSQPIAIPRGSDNTPATPSSRGSVTSSSFGTPHVKHHSPFSKLPSVDNFNKNISDVIDFENLPDSVGKYESMCNVISKIRSFMSLKSSKK